MGLPSVIQQIAAEPGLALVSARVLMVSVVYTHSYDGMDSGVFR